jgi:hypothetical protein
MPQREFANQKALVAYAEQNDLAYEYEYTPAFAKWQRLLSPEQYEIVEARTSRGVSRVMLFSKAIIQAEWEANAPLREALAIKRERLRALRAKRAASGRQSSGPNGLSRGCKVLCSRRLIRDRLGQYRGNGSCLRFWVHACSKWCGAVEV